MAAEVAYYAEKLSQCEHDYTELQAAFSKYKHKTKSKFEHLRQDVAAFLHSNKIRISDSENAALMAISLAETQMRLEESQQQADTMHRELAKRQTQLNDQLILIKNLEEQLSSQLPLSDAERKERRRAEGSDMDKIHSQILYKDQRIIELNNVILDKERQILDLQESLKEQGEVAVAKSQAMRIVHRRMEEMESRGRREQGTETDASLWQAPLQPSSRKERLASIGSGAQRTRSASPGHAVANRGSGMHSPPPLDPSEEQLRRPLALSIGGGEGGVGEEEDVAGTSGTSGFKGKKNLDQERSLARQRQKKRVTFDLPASPAGSGPATPVGEGGGGGGGVNASTQASEKERAEDKQKMDEMVSAMMELTGENERLLDVLEEHRKMVDKAEKERNEAEARREAAESSMEREVRDARQASQRARSAASTRIRDLETHLALVDRQHAEQTERLRVEIETLRSTREWEVEENARLRQQLQMAREKCDRLRSELDSSLAHNAELDGKVAEGAAHVEDMVEDMEGMEQIISFLETQKVSILDDVDRLKEALLAQGDYIEMLETDMVIYEQHIGILRESLGASKVDHRVLLRSKAFETKLRALEQEKEQINRKSNDERLRSKALHAKARLLEEENEKLVGRLCEMEMRLAVEETDREEESRREMERRHEREMREAVEKAVEECREALEATRRESMDRQRRAAPNQSVAGAGADQPGPSGGPGQTLLGEGDVAAQVEQERRHAGERVSALESELSSLRARVEEAVRERESAEREAELLRVENFDLQSRADQAEQCMLEEEDREAADKEQRDEMRRKLDAAEKERLALRFELDNARLALAETEAVKREVLELKKQLESERLLGAAKWQEMAARLADMERKREEEEEGEGGAPSRKTSVDLMYQQYADAYNEKIAALEAELEEAKRKMDKDRQEKRKLKAAVRQLRDLARTTEETEKELEKEKQEGGAVEEEQVHKVEAVPVQSAAPATPAPSQEDMFPEASVLPAAAAAPVAAVADGDEKQKDEELPSQLSFLSRRVAELELECALSTELNVELGRAMQEMQQHCDTMDKENRSLSMEVHLHEQLNHEMTARLDEAVGKAASLETSQKQTAGSEKKEAVEVHNDESAWGWGDEAEEEKEVEVEEQQSHVQLDALVAENEELLREVERERQKYSSDHSDWLSRLESANAATTAMAEQLRAAGERMSQMEREQEARETEISSLHVDESAMAARVAELESLLADKAEDESAKEWQLKEAEERLTTAQAEIQAMSARLAVDRAETQQTAEEDGEMREELERLERQLEQGRVAWDEREQQYAAWQASHLEEMHRQEGVVETLQRRLASSQTAVDSSVVAELTGQIEELKKQLEEMSGREEVVEEMNRQVEQLQKLLVEKEQEKGEKEKLRKQLEEKQAEVDELVVRVCQEKQRAQLAEQEALLRASASTTGAVTLATEELSMGGEREEEEEEKEECRVEKVETREQQAPAAQDTPILEAQPASGSATEELFYENSILRECVNRQAAAQHSMDGDVGRLMELREDLETAVDALRGEIWTLNGQLKASILDREQLADRVCSLDSQLEGEKKRADQLDAELSEQVELLEKAQRRAAEAENESNRRLQECLQMENTREELERAYQQLTEYYEQLQTAYDAVYARINSERAEVGCETDVDGRTLETAMEALCRQPHYLSEMAAVRAELDETRTLLCSEMASFEADLSSSIDRVQMLLTRVVSIEHVRAVDGSSTQQERELEEMLDAIIAECGLEAGSDVQSKVDRVHAALRERLEELQQCKRAIGEQRRVCAALEERLEEMEAETQRSGESQTSRVRLMDDELFQRNEECNELRSKVAELQALVDRVSANRPQNAEDAEAARLATRQRDCDALFRGNAELAHTNVRLQNELDRQGEERAEDDVSSELDRLRTVERLLLSQIASMEEQLIDASERITELQMEKQEMQEEEKGVKKVEATPVQSAPTEDAWGWGEEEEREKEEEEMVPKSELEKVQKELTELKEGGEMERLRQAERILRSTVETLEGQLIEAQERELELEEELEEKEQGVKEQKGGENQAVDAWGWEEEESGEKSEGGEEVASLRDQVDQLRSQLAEAERKADKEGEEEEELTRLRSVEQLLKSAVEAMEGQLIEAQEREHELMEQLADKEEEEQKKKEESQHRSAAKSSGWGWGDDDEKTEGGGEMAELEEQLEQLRTQLADRADTAALKEVEERLEEKTDQCERLEKRVRQLEATIVELEKAEQKEEQKEEEWGWGEEEATEKEDASAELADAKALIEQLQEELDSARSALDKLKSEKDAEAEKLREGMRRQLEEIEQLEQDHAEEIRLREEEAAQLNEQIALMEQEKREEEEEQRKEESQPVTAEDKEEESGWGWGEEEEEEETDVSARLAALTEEVESERSGREEAEALVDGLKRLVEELREKLASLESSAASSRSSREEEEEEEEEREEVEMLQVQLAATRTEVAAANQLIARLEAETAAAIEEQVTSEQIQSELLAEVEQLRKQLEEKEQPVEKEESGWGWGEEEEKEKKGEEELEQRMREAGARCAELEREVAEERERLAGLEQAHRLAAEEWQDRERDMLVRIAELEAEIARLQSLLAEKEEEKEQAERQQAGAEQAEKEEVEELRRELEQREKELEAMRRQNSLLKDSESRLLESVDEYGNELEKAQEERDRLQQVVNQLERDGQSAEEQRAVLEQRLAEQEQEVEKAKKAGKSSKAQPDETAAVDKLRAEVASKTSQLERVIAEKIEASTRLAETETRLRQAEQERSKIKTAYDQLRAKIAARRAAAAGGGGMGGGGGRTSQMSRRSSITSVATQEEEEPQFDAPPSHYQVQLPAMTSSSSAEKDVLRRRSGMK